jgi:hypothetical protein
MVLTGPPNSGKTSWLEPILAVLDRRHLATCTEEKKFSCQMINEQTQLIWLDEWKPGLYLQLFVLLDACKLIWFTQYLAIIYIPVLFSSSFVELSIFQFFLTLFFIGNSVLLWKTLNLIIIIIIVPQH